MPEWVTLGQQMRQCNLVCGYFHTETLTSEIWILQLISLATDPAVTVVMEQVVGPWVSTHLPVSFDQRFSTQHTLGEGCRERRQVVT